MREAIFLILCLGLRGLCQRSQNSLTYQKVKSNFTNIWALFSVAKEGGMIDHSVSREPNKAPSTHKEGGASLFFLPREIKSIFHRGRDYFTGASSGEGVREYKGGIWQ